MDIIEASVQEKLAEKEMIQAKRGQMQVKNNSRSYL